LVIAISIPLISVVKAFGGKVLAFDKITSDMVDLTGGVVKDEQM
jgi:nitrous oxide reductase accessory protein NosL